MKTTISKIKFPDRILYGLAFAFLAAGCANESHEESREIVASSAPSRVAAASASIASTDDAQHTAFDSLSTTFEEISAKAEEAASAREEEAGKKKRLEAEESALKRKHELTMAQMQSNSELNTQYFALLNTMAMVSGLNQLVAQTMTLDCIPVPAAQPVPRAAAVNMNRILDAAEKRLEALQMPGEKRDEGNMSGKSTAADAKVNDNRTSATPQLEEGESPKPPNN